MTELRYDLQISHSSLFQPFTVPPGEGGGAKTVRVLQPDVLAYETANLQITCDKYTTLTERLIGVNDLPG